MHWANATRRFTVVLDRESDVDSDSGIRSGAGIFALSKLDNDRGQRVVTVDLDFSLRADHNSATSFCYVPLCGCTGQEFEYTDCYERGNCHWLVPRTFQAGVPNSRPVPRRKQGVNCEWNALEICVVPTDSHWLRTFVARV